MEVVSLRVKGEFACAGKGESLADCASWRGGYAARRDPPWLLFETYYAGRGRLLRRGGAAYENGLGRISRAQGFFARRKYIFRVASLFGSVA